MSVGHWDSYRPSALNFKELTLWKWSEGSQPSQSLSPSRTLGLGKVNVTCNLAECAATEADHSIEKPLYGLLSLFAQRLWCEKTQAAS